jgi:hypothetical protein
MLLESRFMVEDWVTNRRTKSFLVVSSVLVFMVQKRLCLYSAGWSNGC